MTLHDTDIYARVSDDDGVPQVTTEASPDDKAPVMLETPDSIANRYDSFEAMIRDVEEWAILRDRNQNGSVRCHTLCPVDDLNNVQPHIDDALLHIETARGVGVGNFEHLSTRYFNELEIVSRETLQNRLALNDITVTQSDRGTEWQIETDSLDDYFYEDNPIRLEDDGRAEWVVAYNRRDIGGNGEHGAHLNHQIFLPVEDIEFTDCVYGYGLDLPETARMYWDGPNNPGTYQMTISNMYVVSEQMVPPESDT